MLAPSSGGRPRRPSTFRPALEVLEDRCLLTVPAPVVSAPIPVSATVSSNTALVVYALAPMQRASSAGTQDLPTQAMPLLFPRPALSQSLGVAPTLTLIPAPGSMTRSASFVQFFLSGGGGQLEDPSMESPKGGNPGAGSQPDGATEGGAASREDGGGNSGTGNEPDDAVWLDFVFTQLP